MKSSYEQVESYIDELVGWLDDMRPRLFSTADTRFLGQSDAANKLARKAEKVLEDLALARAQEPAPAEAVEVTLRPLDGSGRVLRITFAGENKNADRLASLDVAYLAGAMSYEARGFQFAGARFVKVLSVQAPEADRGDGNP